MKRSGPALPVIGNPVACNRITDPDNVNRIRRIDCRSYDRCLDFAVDSGWRGFHCNECRGYEAPTPEEQRRDYMGALTLLAETQLLASLAVPEPVFVDETDEDEDELDVLEHGQEHEFDDEQEHEPGLAPGRDRTDTAN